ncbi:MAG: phospholipase [Acidobacteriota bacterium]|nr:phospholipase [Acidobacteriota bacterium]
MLTTHTIPATVHGRFLVREGPPERLLIGFHGYAETADIHIEELSRIRGIDRWTVAAIQALHPFYSRTQQVVASWMTRLDRELALADNIAYVRSVIETFHDPETVVFFGYSQGAAMAYRGAANYGRGKGLIALGGDVPPDVVDNVPPALVARGARDEWYSEEKFKKDLSFLRTITRVTSCAYEGGHEWTDEFRQAAAKFLESIA